MQILELCDVVNFGIDDDPLQHASVSGRRCRQWEFSRDLHLCYAEKSDAIRVIQSMSWRAIRTFATSSRVNALSSLDAIAKGGGVG
jgi:hypothetical protein